MKISKNNNMMHPPQEIDTNILLADIRGFTSLSERHHPLKVVELLNFYFNQMIPLIAAYGGRVDKLMGDAILAVFDAAGDHKNAALQTLAAAIEMQVAMDVVSRYGNTLGIDGLYMGIGVNSGRVISGVMGNEHYSELTVIGDDVNLAARIEAFSLRGQVLLGEKTYDLVKEDIEVGAINHIEAKGKSGHLVIYELQSVLRPLYLQLPEREPRKSPRVSADFFFVFQIIQHKIVLEYEYKAEVKDACYGGFGFVTEINIEPLSDLRLSMQLPLVTPERQEFYVKVLHVSKMHNSYGIGVEITSASMEAKKLLKTFVDISL